MKVLVIGSSGQLGSEIKELITIQKKHINDQWLFAYKSDINLLDFNQIKKKLNILKPDFLINCAAYTDVDNAEGNKKIVNTINFLAVGVISKWCYANNCKMIHISTDYVFGSKTSKLLKKTMIKYR